MSNLARTVALLLVALCAGAQAAVVGIYFDENATCAAGIVQRYTAAPAYLIFSSMPSSTINAWEINLACYGLTILDLRARNQSIVVGVWPGDYMCGLASPQPVVNGRYIAADITIMPNTATGASNVRGGAVHFHYMPANVPCYLDANNNAYALQSAVSNAPLVVVNGPNPCTVEDEASSFGTVKSLFR